MILAYHYGAHRHFSFAGGHLRFLERFTHKILFGVVHVF
jgi:hypothetical protein